MQITKRIPEMVNSAQAIAYWEELPEGTRRDYFESARADTFAAIGAEAELGLHDRRTYYGRGSVTAQAVDDAYHDSAEFGELLRGLEEERRARYDAQEYDCIVCGCRTIAKRSMVAEIKRSVTTVALRSGSASSTKRIRVPRFRKFQM